MELMCFISRLQTTLRPFLFSKLSLTDDDDRATTDEKIVRGMGSISLRVYRVKVTGPSLATSTSVTASRKPDFVPAVLHESSKKAQISHQTGFGHAEKDRPKSRVNYDRIDPRKTPCFTLGLHYRSRTILEFEGIVEGRENCSETRCRQLSDLYSLVHSCAGTSTQLIDGRSRWPIKLKV